VALAVLQLCPVGVAQLVQLHQLHGGEDIVAAVPSYAAFLRGMNLGKRRITNDELCRAFARIGFEDARSFRASGNVAFTAPQATPAALAARIEEGLGRELGYPVPTYVRTAAQMREVARAEPFTAAESARSTGKLQVGLLASAPAAAARRRALAMS